MEISNNGTSWPEMVLGSSQHLLIVNSQVLVTIPLLFQLILVYTYMKSVNMKDRTKESAKMNLSLILIGMLCLSEFQKEELSIFMTYLVSMDKTLCLPQVKLV